MKCVTAQVIVAILAYSSFLMPELRAQTMSGVVADAATVTGGTQPSSTTDRLSANKSQYRIGDSDILAINVWREQEISRAVPVRPDGKISLPLIGDVQATGLTVEALEAAITHELKNFIEQPVVTVIVQEARSQRFNVVGEVMKPGSFVLGQPLTVLDALALAGGFKDFAKVKSIYVLRSQGTSSKRLPFNYKQVIKGKNLAQNVQLQAGDTIVVP